MDLTGASAIVVGGAGGLGEATVRRLVAKGVKVVIADLAIDAAEKLSAELGSHTRAIACDVTSSDSISAAIDLACELGPLRVSVDTHGGPGGGRTLNRDGVPLPLEEYKRVLDIFLVGAFDVLRLAAAAMSHNDPLEDGERGVIISTASIAAFEGTVGQIAYAAAKGGIAAMTLVAARDLSPVGIRAVTIAPGTMMTPAYRMPAEQLEAHWGPSIPFPKRMGRADEYGQLAVHIAENSYLNGEVIRLDGALRFTPKGP